MGLSLDRVLFLPYSSFGSIEYLTTWSKLSRVTLIFNVLSFHWSWFNGGQAHFISFIYFIYLSLNEVVGCLKEILKKYSKFTFQHVIIQAGMDMVTDIILSFFLALDAWYNLRDQIYIYIYKDSHVQTFARFKMQIYVRSC